MNNNVHCYSIAVIVTLYNASQYLPQCIDNILSQTFQDFELLLINDGSTDNSREICDEYAKKDKRIKVFHEKHRGVAHARQVGIDNATGKYLLYIDADDIIAPTILQDLYDNAEEDNAEIVICDYTELTHSGEIYKPQKPSSNSGVSLFNDIMNGKLYGALWNKMIKTECIKRSLVKFPEELTMREDLVFLSKLLPHINTVAYVPKALYGYDRRNTSSLTNNYLNESSHYFHQEVLWNKHIIDNSELPLQIIENRLDYYHQLAYISLKSNLFSKEEWLSYFIPYTSSLINRGNGYKKSLVTLGLKGYFAFARFVRTIISKIR